MRKLKIGILLVVSCLFLTACGCTKEDYKVTFDSNGGSSVSSQTVEKGETAKKPTDPTRDGYTFGGWYIDINSDNEYNFSTKVTKNITLTAKWVENGPVETSYTITFNTDGGNSVESIKVEDGKITSLPTPTKTGFKFLGWYSGDKKYEVGSTITGNITLTAKWEKVQQTSTTTPSGNQGGSNTPKPVDPTPVDPTPQPPVEDKYTFKSANYSESPDFKMIFVYKNGEDVTRTVSRVFSASMTNLGAFDANAGAPLVRNEDVDSVSQALINGTTYTMTRVY